MKLGARLSKLEQMTPARPVRFVWADEGEDASAKIAQMVRSGAATAEDKFIVVGWRHAA
jgi:hypothetical protein